MYVSPHLETLNNFLIIKLLKMSIEEILHYLDSHEIDYRLESNFCCSYIFYFLDGSIYPRRYHDVALEGEKVEYLAESAEHLIARKVSVEMIKDWRHRIEAVTIKELFVEVEKWLKK